MKHILVSLILIFIVLQPSQTFARTHSPPEVPKLNQYEYDVLSHGRIDSGTKSGAMVASGLVGFGIGQGMIGKYDQSGWIFTLADTVSLIGITGFTLGMIEASRKSDERSRNNPNYEYNGEGALEFMGLCLSIAGLATSRTFSIIDVHRKAKRHNAAYDMIESKLDRNPRSMQLSFAPVLNKDQFGGQLQIRF